MPASATRTLHRERTRVSQDELAEIIVRHELYRTGRVGGKRALLAWRDLSDLDLSGCDLQEANLTGAFLVGADLQRANLDHAELYCTNLTRANLAYASLVRADLRGAILRGADLTGADLFDADLRDGRLTQLESGGGDLLPVELQSDLEPATIGAQFVQANLSQARLSGAAVQYTDFSDAIMRGSKLVRANLAHACFDGADLHGADLSGADLSGASLRDAVLTEAVLGGANTAGADMTGSLTSAVIGRALGELPLPFERMVKRHEEWVESGGKSGEALDLSGFDLRQVPTLASARLTALRARGAVFYGLDMENVWLQGAKLLGADLRGCKLAGGDLRGINLTGAKLNGADLREARLGPLLVGINRTVPSRLDDAQLRHVDLRGADLTRASVANADLRSAKLTGANLEGVDLATALLLGASGLIAP